MIFFNVWALRGGHNPRPSLAIAIVLGGEVVGGPNLAVIVGHSLFSSRSESRQSTWFQCWCLHFIGAPPPHSGHSITHKVGGGLERPNLWLHIFNRHEEVCVLQLLVAQPTEFNVNFFLAINSLFTLTVVIVL